MEQNFDMLRNQKIMELGTKTKDENGQDLPEIDWSKTTAVCSVYCHIFINLKGREPEGIVDPADQFELEEKIMTDLYSLRDEKTGHRVIALALRNKRTGIENPMFWDSTISFADGNPVPHGSYDELMAGARKMYHELSPETPEFIDIMQDNEMFDVLSPTPAK